MKRHSITAIAAAIALAFSAGALAAKAITNDEFSAGKDKIAAVYQADQAACASLAANAKDVCMAAATGRQKVAKAELDARKIPGDQTRRAVTVARAEADYAVAKEKCDDQAGAAKDTCVKDAKAAETRALADTKAPMKTSAATKAGTTVSASTDKAGEYLEDSVITGKVKAAVLQEPSLKSAEINVETYKNVVQLSGFVASQASIDRAVMVARSVDGVKSVKNDMIVKGKQ